MQISKFSLAMLLGAASLAAQGPPPGGPGFGPRPMDGGPGPVVTGAPYSAVRTTQEQQTLSDGNQIQSEHQSKVYRDSQGRTRTESTVTTPSGQTETLITIFDPVTGYAARLNQQKLTATKHALPSAGSGRSGAAPQRPSGTNGPQIQTEDLGSKTIGGLNATGTRKTMTIPAGAAGNAEAITITREIWISSALKVPLLVTVSDPLHGNSTTQLANISQSEPEASLFQIPSNYTVTTESGPGSGGFGGGPGGPPPPGSN